jgi:hypothetical protein
MPAGTAKWFNGPPLPTEIADAATDGSARRRAVPCGGRSVASFPVVVRYIAHAGRYFGYKTVQLQRATLLFE